MCVIRLASRWLVFHLLQQANAAITFDVCTGQCGNMETITRQGCVCPLSPNSMKYLGDEVRVIHIECKAMNVQKNRRSENLRRCS